MAFLSSFTALIADVTVNAPTGPWVFFIRDVFGAIIKDYGWCVIVFTIALRLVLLPLDFYQKKVAFDNKKKTEAMEPYMEKLRKQYGNDKMAMSAKQRELQKKFKYNTFGPCLPALFSLFIFITLFGGFRKIADYEIYTAYNDTRNAYIASYMSDTDDDALLVNKFNELDALYDRTRPSDIPKIDLTAEDFNYYLNAGENGAAANVLNNKSENLLEAVSTTLTNNSPEVLLAAKAKIFDGLLRSVAQDAAVVEYDAHKDSMKFLWIKNMWRPDAVWGMNGCSFSTIEPVVPTADLYMNSLTSSYMKEYKDTNKDQIKIEYGLVMEKVINVNNKSVNTNGKTVTVYNGYYILAVLIIGLSILSSKFNAAGNIASAPQSVPGAGADGKQPGMPNMKMMMWIMPIMMGVFAISSNSAFSLYMVASTGTSLLSTFLCNFGIKMYDKKKTAKAEENKFKRYEKSDNKKPDNNRPGGKKR